MTDYAVLKDGVLSLCDDTPDGCDWQLYFECDTQIYKTECGYAFQFMGDGTKEAEFIYCPYCGKTINDIEE